MITFQQFLETDSLNKPAQVVIFKKIIIRALRPKWGMVKGKAIPVTGRGGQYRCETSRFPYFLDNRHTEGGEVVSLTRRPHFTPQEVPGTHFC
jgi:hypothetical protein